MKHDSVKKVPVIMQLEEMECGVSALAMVCAYYGKWVPVEKMRIDCGVSRDGVSAGNIARAGGRYGLKIKGITLEADMLRSRAGKDISMPCILHWKMKHYVVLCGFKGDKAVINDPSNGRLVIPYESFKHDFSGICLTAEPDDSFEPSGHKKSIFDFAKKRLKSTMLTVIFMIAVMLINSLFGFLDPLFKEQFLDHVLGADENVLRTFIMVMAAVCIGELVISVVQTLKSLSINGGMDREGSTSYVKKLLTLPVDYFYLRNSSELTERKNANASITLSVVNILAPLVIQTVMMLFYFVIMLERSLLLTAIGVISVALNLIVSRVVTEKRMDVTRALHRDSGKYKAMTILGVSSNEGIRATGAVKGFMDGWKELQDMVYSGKESLIRYDALLSGVSKFISLFASDLVMISGIYLAIKGEMTLGMVMAFIGFLASFMTPANTVVSSGQRLREMRVNIERIEDVMEYPSDIGCDMWDEAYTDAQRQKTTSEKHELSGSLMADSLTFGYSRMGEPLIKDFSLDVKVGTKTAIIGGSGSGKSTLIKLLSGIYMPWEGEVSYDGRKMSAIGHDAFRRAVSVVDQKAVLFEGSVRDNIKMFRTDISDELMISAAKDACIHEEIMARGGYDSYILSGGKNLSGGERQRIEIARALLMEPALLMLDEATSQLDEETEKKVIGSIERRGITVIVVTHRLYAIKDANEIIVLENGKVAERGTHEELMSDHSVYAKLYGYE